MKHDERRREIREEMEKENVCFFFFLYKRKKKKEKKRKGVQEGWDSKLDGTSGMKEGLNEDWVFPDVNEKGIRGPTSHELNESRCYAVFSKGGGSTRLHGLTGNVLVEETTEVGDEELPGGYGTVM